MDAITILKEISQVKLKITLLENNKKTISNEIKLYETQTLTCFNKFEEDIKLYLKNNNYVFGNISDRPLVSQAIIMIRDDFQGLDWTDRNKSILKCYENRILQIYSDSPKCLSVVNALKVVIEYYRSQHGSNDYDELALLCNQYEADVSSKLSELAIAKNNITNLDCEIKATKSYLKDLQNIYAQFK